MWLLCNRTYVDGHGGKHGAVEVWVHKMMRKGGAQRYWTRRRKRGESFGQRKR